MVEGVFSLLLCCESGANQEVGKKSLTDMWEASIM